MGEHWFGKPGFAPVRVRLAPPNNAGVVQSVEHNIANVEVCGFAQVLNTCAMEYEKHYNALIERAKQRGIKKKDISYYTEAHRILPGCLGGTYRKDNVALLTPEEHYVAHQLLVKMYPEERRLVYALSNMTQGRPNNKRYGWVKRKYQSECKRRTGKNNHGYGKSWYFNPETYERKRFVPGNEPQGWMKGKFRKKCLNCGHFTKDYETKYCSNVCRKNSHKKQGKVSQQDIEKTVQKRSAKSIKKDKEVALQLQHLLVENKSWKMILQELGFKNTDDHNSRERIKRIAKEYNLVCMRE